MRSADLVTASWLAAPFDAGMVTRYLVDLDGGGELQVVRQNLETSSGEALDAKGRAVLLEWRPEHQLEIDTEPGETEGEQ